MIIENPEDEEAIRSSLRIFKARSKGKFSIGEALEKTKKTFSEDDALDKDINAKTQRHEFRRIGPNSVSFKINDFELQITKTDRKIGEKETGADLIYHAISSNKFLLIQHKIVKTNDRRIIVDEQLKKQFARLFSACGGIRIRLGNIEYRCTMEHLDKLTIEQASQLLDKVRLLGYCPSFLKICIADESRNSSIDEHSNGSIYPACIAYLHMKVNGSLKPKIEKKSIRHTELENMFANCLIGKEDDLLDVIIESVESPPEFYAKEMINSDNQGNK